jgi:phosphoglycolate phosphatase
MLRYDAVIFDLDGTLLDTLDDLMNATNYALEQMGFPQRTRKEVEAFVGNGVAKLMERAVPAGTSPEDTARALNIFKPYYARHSKDKTAPYPGIIETLNTLRTKGCKLAVVSNKFDAAVKVLAQDYFPGLMDLAAGENEAGGVPKKPDATMVFQTLAALAVTPGRAVYVGDSDVDLQTAKNAGLPCISVTWGFRDREFLLAHGADTLIDRPSELLERIF